MFLYRIVALSLLAASTTAMADSVDFTFRDTSAQFQYRASMGRDALGKSEFHIGALYVDKDDMLSDIGIFVKDELGGNAPGFSVGVGVKAVVGKARGDNLVNSDAAALALGAMLRYSPPAISRLGFVGQVYLSPNVVTFGDADRYVEAGTRAEFEIIPQAVVYIGYRRIGFGIKTQSFAVIDKGANFGVRISF